MREAREEPGQRAERHRQHEGPVAERGQRDRHHDAGERGHRLDREVDPAQHDDEGHAGREDEEHGRVAGELEQRRGLQEDRLQRADQRHEHDQRGERQPLAQPVRPEAADQRRHQTMCPIRSTWRGFAPGLASARWVISPSRMTSTVWLSPMVSSSVSEVRITREALGGDRAHQLVDLLLGADVEAAGRMVEDQHPRLRLQPLGQHHLLLVAAGEVEAERLDAGRADPQPLDPVAWPARRSLPVSMMPCRVRLAEVGQRDVGGHRQEQHQPLDPPLARDIADPGVDRLGRASRSAAGRPPTRSVPPSCGAKPASVRVSSSRPEPITPAMPRISPACSVKLDAPGRPGRATSSFASTSTAGRVGPLQRLAVVFRLQAARRPSSGAASPRPPPPPRARPPPPRPSSRRCGRRAPAPRRAGARRR